MADSQSGFDDKQGAGDPWTPIDAQPDPFGPTQVPASSPLSFTKNTGDDPPIPPAVGTGPTQGHEPPRHTPPGQGSSTYDPWSYNSSADGVGGWGYTPPQSGYGSAPNPYPPNPYTPDPYAANPYVANPYATPGYPYGAGVYGYPVAPRTNSRATVALVCGLISVAAIFVFSFLSVVVSAPTGIVAIVMGLKARREIADSGGMQTGSGNALAGIIVGSIGLVLSLVVTIGLIALIVWSNSI